MSALLNQAPLWDERRSVSIGLWHGCTDRDRRGIEQNGIDLSRSRINLDFGRGFYATTLRRQAEHWAFRRYESRWVVKENNRPVLLWFKIRRTELAILRSMHFVLGDYESEDYWSLVQHCRQSKVARGRAPERIKDHLGPVIENGCRWYDVVYGPVVADWKQLATLSGMDQVSFHTQSAIALLNGAIRSGSQEQYQWHPVRT